MNVPEGIRQFPDSLQLEKNDTTWVETTENVEEYVFGKENVPS